MSRSPIRVACRFIGFVVCLSAAVAAAQDIPIATGRDYTARNFWADVLTMNRRMIVGGYQQHGRRDPKWDQQTLAVLEEAACSFTASDAPADYDPPCPTGREIAEHAQQVLDLGCDDPMVLYICATMTHAYVNRDQGAAMLKRAADELANSDYHPNRKYLAEKRYENILASDDPQRKVYHDRAEQRIAGLLFAADPDAPMFHRFLLEVWNLRGASSKWWKPYIEAMEKMDGANVDPWMRDVCLGIYHIRLAWDSRGSGWAKDVTPEGWKGFFENLHIAAACLIAAHIRHPDRPEAAAQMITVTMGRGDKALTERQWFDRAIAAQFDYMPAYTNYRYAILPRWGGSHELMYEFGLECARTRRFDTLVPYQFFSILGSIDSDRDNDHRVYLMPGVFEAGKELFEGALASPDRANHRNYDHTYYGGFAWRCGRLDVARQQLDQVVTQDPAGKPCWEWLGTTGNEAIPLIYALSSPAGKTIEKADEALAARRLTEARDGYQAAQADVGDDARARAYLAGQAKRTDWLLKFDAGQAVELTPAADLSGWIVHDGQWSVNDEGWIVGKSTKAGLMLLTELDLGTDWELSGTLDFSQCKPGKNANGGIIHYMVSPFDFRSYVLYPRQGKCWNLSRFKTGRSQPLEQADRYDFRMIRIKGYSGLEIDGKQIFAARATEWNYDGHLFGLGGRYDDVPGYTVRYGNLKLHRVIERPAWVDKLDAEQQKKDAE